MKYYEVLEKLSQEHPVLIENLIATDDLEKWGGITKNLSKDDKSKIYDLAEPKWIERKIINGTLLLHPDVRAELIARNYKPLSIHRKMIWASVLVMYEGSDSKERYNRLKNKIIKKHSNKWWFDVHKRVKPTYAAKSRIEKQTLGNATSFAAQNSSFLGGVVQDVRDDALKMIPSE
jgi:hypothetical protein|tara:strand:- start:105 stop:632 length:528 start_codon:yes stop_codon:yes gene_type:complete